MYISCLNLPIPIGFLVIETDASNIGYGGILKQGLLESKQEEVVRYDSSICLGPQINYSTIKKEILSIILCIQNFQDDFSIKVFY